MNIHAPPAAERLTRDDRSALMRSERRTAIMAAAIKLAAAGGWRNLTRDRVASAAGVAVGSVNHEFGTMGELRAAVMREAVASERLEIIAQGLADGDETARDAPAELREAAIRSLA
jgi:AcrR family transcriptional regulator